MKFRTELNIEPSEFKIALTDPILTIGSCFSNTIGNKLKDNKFDVLINPFGTIYNPISIFKMLTTAIERSSADSNLYIEHDGLFSHFDFHSSFTAASKDELERLLTDQISQVHNYLKSAKYLIITPGTAFVYRYSRTSEPVSNCHKVPAKEFEKLLLNQKEILASFEGFKSKLESFNSEVKLIFTVSPVRHIKDTIELNSVSKSTLRLTCHTLREQYGIDYFPSYELVLDDLRDYRFYNADMLHPNNEAVEYIWNKFSDKYFSNDTKQFLSEWNKIRSAIDHRPFNPFSDKHQVFIKNTINKINDLKVSVDFRKEIQFLEDQLTS